ncbi:hypothetical protein WN943_029550 [Citrus x changshan-huyou]
MVLKGLSTTWGDEPTNHILASLLESSKYRDQNLVTNHATYLVFKCDYGYEKGILDFGVYIKGSGHGVRRRPFLDPSRNMALPSENRGYGWMEIEMV